MHSLPRHHVLWKPSLLLYHGYGNPPFIILYLFRVKQQLLYLIPCCVHDHPLCGAFTIIIFMCITLHKHREVCLCLGGGDCDPGESHENDVIVFGRSEGRRERVVLDTLPYSAYRVRHTTKHLLYIKTV